MHLYHFIWLISLSFVEGNPAQTALNIHGSVAPKWEFVRDMFRDNILQEQDLGASLAIYYQGEPVVDLTGGWFDNARTKPYDKNALQVVFSTTKGLVAVAVALCVQRGLLNYSTRVTEYWPEYGQNGKENTTVADIMSHRAGLPNDNATFEENLNWTATISKLEKLKPQWEPGTAHGYHAITYGFLAGELVRRVDPKKRTFGQFVREEIADPLNIEFYVGLPSEEEHRVSPLKLKAINANSFAGITGADENEFNSNLVHRAEIPAANGITNAWSLARFYASLMTDLDHSRTKRILTEETLQLAIKSNTPKNENDFIFGTPSQFGLGFLLLDDVLPSFKSVVFGHNGIGGSVGLAVPSKNFSFAYVVNLMDVENPSEFDRRYLSILDKIGSMLSDHE